ncbi:MAG: DUF2748 family protein [Alphaproteobacteria bacterium]|nr:DUF2748 family protein [Alphaproteobacteria bacterium]
MPNSNEYHLLHFIPAVEAWEMPPVLEQMAQQLVKSGRLRINADHERNFVKYSTVDSDRSFSARELTNPELLPKTRQTIAQSVPMGLGDAAIDDVLEQLHRELKKARGIDEAKELKVARVLMQSAHPAVMLLALREGAEFFVSYSHNVGDLMAMHFWQTHGTASGLQSAADEGLAIYVSCSGDPFFEGEEKTYTTDGWPALARMVVIAGQEIGHYADLRRTAHGITGRISADTYELAPSPACKAARDADRQRLMFLLDSWNQRGLGALLKAEQVVDFYSSRLRFSPRYVLAQMWRALVWVIFAARHIGALPTLHTYPRLRCATGLTHFVQDMAFNLSPNADAYRRDDPIEEEAIACIEALARVPQQVNKWGHGAVKLAIPNMYRLYYGSVIPNVTAALPNDLLELARKANKNNIIQLVIAKLRRLFSSRAGWHPKSSI